MGAVRLTQDERRATTQARLLDATEDALLERGYAALTLADVASRAGVTTGAVQRHFETKQGLLLAVFDRAAERQLEATARLQAGGPGLPLADRLQEAMLQVWRAIDVRRQQVIDQLAQAALVDPTLHDSLLEHARRSSQLISDQLVTVFGPEFVDNPSFDTAMIMITLMFRGLAAVRTQAGSDQIDRFIGDAARLLVEGIRTSR